VARLIVLVWLACWARLGLGDDPAQRLKLSEPVQLSYKETRTLALLAQPWRGRGYLLADPQGTLVKLQLSPQRVIMAATPRELLYFDPASGERYRLPLPAPPPQAEGILVLQQLLRGDLESIRRRYRVDYEEDEQGWRLKLAPLSDDSPYRQVLLRGDAQGKRQVLVVIEQDGDRTVTEMTVDERGSQLSYTIARLLQEALGQ